MQLYMITFFHSFDDEHFFSLFQIEISFRLRVVNMFFLERKNDVLGIEQVILGKHQGSMNNIF